VPRVMIIGDEHQHAWRLSKELVERGFDCSIAFDGEFIPKKVAEQAPDLLLVSVNECGDSSGVDYLAQRPNELMGLPAIALLSFCTLDDFDLGLPVDDFVAKPWDVSEVALRIRRTLQRANGIGKERLIRCGDLVIDVDNCEVTVDGRLVTLTFKEYELLRFLASNKGRVFTRDVLLNEVWGYDYYGGDRTVDVHIRRLRSKIEDSTHIFIETVRNIGYRFIKQT
jgi:two-component system alkaline phosphatase synthesis response regulator PhoP